MDLDGGYSNEFEAAYDLSRREYNPADELDKIMALIEAGKYVVVYRHEVCCKFTDAMLGVEHHVGSVHTTKDEAMAACGEENEACYVMGPDDRLPDEQAVDAQLDALLGIPDEDIPF